MSDRLSFTIYSSCHLNGVQQILLPKVGVRPLGVWNPLYFALVGFGLVFGLVFGSITAETREVTCAVPTTHETNLPTDNLIPDTLISAPSDLTPSDLTSSAPKPAPALKTEVLVFPIDGRELLAQGNLICFNQRLFYHPWIHWRSQQATTQSAEQAASGSFGIADFALTEMSGFELLNTSDVLQQPIRWPYESASQLPGLPWILPTQLTTQARYLDIANLVQEGDWQVEIQDQLLQIQTPLAELETLGVEWQPEGIRMMLNFDRAPLWHVQQAADSATLVIDADISSDLLKVLQGQRLPPKRDISEPAFESTSETIETVFPVDTQRPDRLNVANLPFQLTAIPGQTTFHFPANLNPFGLQQSLNPGPIVSLLVNPPRLVIEMGAFTEISPEASAQIANANSLSHALTIPWVERSIAWAPGITWQQTSVTIEDIIANNQDGNTDNAALRPEQHTFFVSVLTVDPRNPQLTLKPIWTGKPTSILDSTLANLTFNLATSDVAPSALNPWETIVGLTSLQELAQMQQAIGAINAGFFNRNTQMPLGAIRQDGVWISGPILVRGAIGWDDRGNFGFARLTLEETLSIQPDTEQTTGQTPTFQVLNLNTGYVQAGLARYTAAWGRTYTPLTDNEILIAIEDDRVTTKQTTDQAGTGAFAIPPDGYLLVARAYKTAADQFQPDAPVQLTQKTRPENFDTYPHILGAGPLLVQNSQIVLNGDAEGFSASFNRQAAVRSAIGLTGDGLLQLVTVRTRVGDLLPTLQHMAQIMRAIGAIDALNLDGGSSSSLYLGGRLVNRSSQTAARVHNGLGVFLHSPQP